MWSGCGRSEGSPAVWKSRSLVAADSDVIAIEPCDLDLEGAWREVSVLVRRSEWRQLSATGSGDGDDPRQPTFNRPGRRLVESAEILAECLHPGVP